MNNHIRILDYKFDKELLLLQAEEARKTSSPYTDVRYPELTFDDWHIGHYTSPYIEKIMRDFDIKGKPRFYWLEPYAEIPTHTDNGTRCSLNLVLTEDAAPIQIGHENEMKTYNYEVALLNTTIPHSVLNNDKQRIMLKISVFDDFFETVNAKINSKKL